MVEIANKLHFRCVKIVKEEKKSITYDGGEKDEKTYQDVQVTFDCMELSEDREFTYSHGYLSLTMTLERFQSLRYEVGKVYELGPT